MARRPQPRGRGIGLHASRVMFVRQWHAYLSVFVAPTILFFAFTGALQLFSLHEAHGDYKPPALIEKLGTLHKDQKFEVKPPRAAAAERKPAIGDGDWLAPMGAKADHAPDVDHDKDHDHGEEAEPLKVVALKWLFCAAAMMLMISTLLGVWMAVTQNRRKVVLLVLLLAGAAAPVAILLLL